MIDAYIEEYGHQFVHLVDSRVTKMTFEFDQVTLCPTAEGYRSLVEQAKIEINPKIMNYLSRRWSEGTIENLSFLVMAVAVYARSILNPPITIDVGKVLLRTVGACNIRCVRRKETGGGCRAAMNKNQHHLPKCIKLPKEITVVWGYVKRYVATGGAICPSDAIGMQDAVRVKVHPESDFSPSASA